MTSTTLDDLEISETFDPHRIEVISPKRVEKIQIYRSNPRFGFYSVLYMSGKKVPGLEGSYKSAHLALDAVQQYLNSVKESREAYRKSIWEDKPVPELQTKKRVPRKKKVADTDGSSKHRSEVSEPGVDNGSQSS